MAHQNQENNPVNPESPTVKRKRGRPRKYDAPGYEPRRRVVQPHVISSQSYPSPGLSQGPLVNSPQANLSALLSLGSQAGSNAAVCSAHGFQDIPSQSNLAPLSGLRPRYNAIQADPPHLRDTGPQNLQAHAASSLGKVNQAIPSQPSLASNSSNRHPANLPATSSNEPRSLVGQTVSGILDGSFDSGYLLTVRLGNTQEILKGLVFDPRLCVPISVENDIAPVVPMITRENLGSVAEALNRQSVFSSAHCMPIPVSFDPQQTDETLALLDPTNYPPKSSSPIGTTSELIRNAIRIDGNPAPDDVRHAVQADVQTKQLQPMLAAKDTDENEKSLQVTLQQHNLSNAESDKSLGLAIKETSQLQSDQTEKQFEIPGLCAGQEIIEESSKVILEPPARDHDLHQAVESSAVELAIGNDIQNSLQNRPQQPPVGNAECETSLSLAINNEASQIDSDQIGNVTRTLGLDEGKFLTEESFKVSLEAPEKSHELSQAVESTAPKEQQDQVESSLPEQHGGDEDRKQQDQVESSLPEQHGGDEDRKQQDQVESSLPDQHGGDEDRKQQDQVGSSLPKQHGGDEDWKQQDQVGSSLPEQHGGDEDRKLDGVPSPGQTPADLHQNPDEQIQLPEEHKECLQQP